MFVISIKSDKFKKYAVFALVFLLAVIGGIVYVSKQEVVPANTVGGMNMKASTNEERLSFFSQFGWKVDEEPVEVKEVVIPPDFDEVYTQYNELQKQQGLDLEPYKGVRVKSWSYEIENYPGYEKSDGAIRINILVYNGTVVAGDVSNIELNGFMHTFFIPSEESTDLSTQAG